MFGLPMKSGYQQQLQSIMINGKQANGTVK
jgi:hypothetical protein